MVSVIYLIYSGSILWQSVNSVLRSSLVTNLKLSEGLLKGLVKGLFEACLRAWSKNCLNGFSSNLGDSR